MQKLSKSDSFKKFFYTIVPPFTWITWPVIYLESSLAKYRYAGASSNGWPALFKGVSVPKISTSWALKEEGIKGVQIGPGATALTRIFWSARDNARDLVNTVIAPFVEE